MNFKLFKIVFFLIAIIGYVDKLINPHFQYLGSDFQKVVNYNIIIMFSILIGTLLLIIFSYFFEINKNVVNIAKLIHILFSIYFINNLFYLFDFNELIDFFVVSSFLIPSMIIIKDTIKVSSFHISNNFIYIGFFLIVLDLIYFNYVYKPYEDYLFGLPILFVHYSIRNWIFILGLIFVWISFDKLLLKNNNEK